MWRSCRKRLFLRRETCLWSVKLKLSPPDGLQANRLQNFKSTKHSETVKIEVKTWEQELTLKDFWEGQYCSSATIILGQKQKVAHGKGSQFLLSYHIPSLKISKYLVQVNEILLLFKYMFISKAGKRASYFMFCSWQSIWWLSQFCLNGLVSFQFGFESDLCKQIWPQKL